MHTNSDFIQKIHQTRGSQINYNIHVERRTRKSKGRDVNSFKIS